LERLRKRLSDVLLLRRGSIANFKKPFKIVRNPYLESKPPVRNQVCHSPDYPETQIAENNLQSPKMEVDNAERHNEEEYQRTGAAIEYPETQIAENNLASQKTEVENAEMHNEEEHERTGAAIEYPETQIAENNLQNQTMEVDNAERRNKEEHVRIQSLLLNSIQRSRLLRIISRVN
jgi:hypothetical protein